MPPLLFQFHAIIFFITARNVFFILPYVLSTANTVFAAKHLVIDFLIFPFTQLASAKHRSVQEKVNAL